MKAVPAPIATWCSNLKLLKSLLPANESPGLSLKMCLGRSSLGERRQWLEIRQPRKQTEPYQTKKGKHWDGGPEKNTNIKSQGLSNSHLKAHPPYRQTALWLRAWKLMQSHFYMPLSHCCQVASVVSNSVWPHRQQPTRLPVPGILQARTPEWVAISFSNAWKWKVKVKSLSRVWLFATSWTAAHQAPPSMGFSRQECWSGVPLPVTLVTW